MTPRFWGEKAGAELCQAQAQMGFWAEAASKYT